MHVFNSLRTRMKSRRDRDPRYRRTFTMDIDDQMRDSAPRIPIMTAGVEHKSKFTVLLVLAPPGAHSSDLWRWQSITGWIPGTGTCGQTNGPLYSGDRSWSATMLFSQASSGLSARGSERGGRKCSRSNTTGRWGFTFPEGLRVEFQPLEPSQDARSS